MRSEHYGDLWVCHALATHAAYGLEEDPIDDITADQRHRHHTYRQNLTADERHRHDTYRQVVGILTMVTAILNDILNDVVHGPPTQRGHLDSESGSTMLPDDTNTSSSEEEAP